MLFLLLVLLGGLMMGCGSGDGGRSTSESTQLSSSAIKSATIGEKEMDEMKKLSSVSLIAKMVFEKTGAITTLVDDYNEALTYLSASSHLSTSKDALIGSLREMVATTREWVLRPTTNVHQTAIVVQGRINPPLSLMRFFAFCRIIRNAARVADTTCQSKMLVDAHNILTGDKFFVDYKIALHRALEQCNVMKLYTDDSDCPKYAFKSELTRLMIQYFHKSMFERSKAAFSIRVVNFLHYWPSTEFEHCPTEEKKQHYVTEYSRAHNMLTQSLDPPPPGICVEDHVQNLFVRFNEEMHLYHLDCPASGVAPHTT